MGLSQTTVSRALNGYPEVKEATRIRVAEAAREHNYRPSNQAKGLATGRAWAIGHVIPALDRHEMFNPIFADFIAGAGETYARHGYEMIMSVEVGGNETDIYTSFKSRRAVDGVMVQGPRIDDPRIELLTNIGLPFAVHGRSSNAFLPYSWLDVNNRSAFERATQFLIDLGHQRIGLINGFESLDFAHRRRAGYEDALKNNKLPIDNSLIFSGEMTEELGYRSALSMLAHPEPPTALLAASLISAMGARRAIEEKGLVMGKDFSIVTHDDVLSYLQNGGNVPIFTSTRSSVRDAGTQLAEMLIAHIENPELPVQQIMLEAELTVGQSTGPAPR